MVEDTDDLGSPDLELEDLDADLYQVDQVVSRKVVEVGCLGNDVVFRGHEEVDPGCNLGVGVLVVLEAGSLALVAVRMRAGCETSAEVVVQEGVEGIDTVDAVAGCAAVAEAVGAVGEVAVVSGIQESYGFQRPVWKTVHWHRSPVSLPFGTLRPYILTNRLVGLRYCGQILMAPTYGHPWDLDPVAYCWMKTNRIGRGCCPIPGIDRHDHLLRHPCHPFLLCRLDHLDHLLDHALH